MSALLNEIGCGSQGANGALVIELPIWLRRRGSELKLVVGEQGRAPRRDRNLVGKLALGFLWLEELTRGAVLSIDAIARREKVSTKVVRRTMDLAFLSTDLIEAIAAGEQPIELTSETIRLAYPLPISWQEQNRVLGCS